MRKMDDEIPNEDPKLTASERIGLGAIVVGAALAPVAALLAPIAWGWTIMLALWSIEAVVFGLVVGSD